MNAPHACSVHPPSHPLASRRQLYGPLSTAKRTAEVIRAIIAGTKFESAEKMLADVKIVGHMMQNARPAELAIGNMVRRILHLIREEADQDVTDALRHSSDSINLADVSASDLSIGPGHERRSSTLSDQGPPSPIASSRGGGDKPPTSGTPRYSVPGTPGSSRGLPHNLSGRGRVVSLANLMEAGQGGVGRTRTSTGEEGPPPSLESSVLDMTVEDEDAEEDEEEDNTSLRGGRGDPRDPRPSDPGKAPVGGGFVHPGGSLKGGALPPPDPTSNPPTRTARFDLTIGNPDGHGPEKSGTHRGAKRRPTTTWSRRNDVIEGVSDLLRDLDTIIEQIAVQGPDHVHANEVILTVGESEAVAAFLLEVKQKKRRNFSVIVAEGSPNCRGIVMAKRLASAGIPCTVITDAAVFAMMARVDKVLISPRAILANGGIVSSVGMHAVALAARHHAAPIVVLGGLYKLSPVYPHQAEVTLNEFHAPTAVCGLATLALPLQGEKGGGSVQVINPQTDYVPPDLIDLFVTDTGGHTSSYIYRLIAEYYHKDDMSLGEMAPGLEGVRGVGGG